jgi:hypothetical protein
MLLEAVSSDTALVSVGSSWQPQGALRIQQNQKELVLSLVHLQESTGFSEVEFFFLDQVFYKVTFVQLIVST